MQNFCQACEAQGTTCASTKKEIFQHGDALGFHCLHSAGQHQNVEIKQDKKLKGTHARCLT
jgi:hypothetical protein